MQKVMLSILFGVWLGIEFSHASPKEPHPQSTMDSLEAFVWLDRSLKASSPRYREGDVMYCMFSDNMFYSRVRLSSGRWKAVEASSMYFYTPGKENVMDTYSMTGDVERQPLFIYDRIGASRSGRYFVCSSAQTISKQPRKPIKKMHQNILISHGKGYRIEWIGSDSLILHGTKDYTVTFDLHLEAFYGDFPWDKNLKK